MMKTLQPPKRTSSWMIRERTVSKFKSIPSIPCSKLSNSDAESARNEQSTNDDGFRFSVELVSADMSERNDSCFSDATLVQEDEVAERSILQTLFTSIDYALERLREESRAVTF